MLSGLVRVKGVGPFALIVDSNVMRRGINSRRQLGRILLRHVLMRRVVPVTRGGVDLTIKEGPCRRARLGTVSSPCFGGCFRAFFEYVKSGSYFLSEFLRRSTVVRRGNIRRVEGVCPNKRS